MPRLVDVLPEVYRPLVPELFQREVPAESKATCASCAMCPSSARGAVDAVDGTSRFFRPDTKCCTFHPRLPSYLVGALLADARPELDEGRRRVRDRLARRTGVTPRWVQAPAKYDALYDGSRNAFGRASLLRCPYFETGSGGCTVWPFREAVCSTFFCKYVAGADGRAFWHALKVYLTLAEIQLTRYAAFHLHPEAVLADPERGASPGAGLSPEDLDDAPPPDAAYEKLWGPWAGREEAYYRACFERVAALTREEFERVVGFDAVVAAAVLGRRHDAAVRPALPAVLKFNPATTVKWLEDGAVALGAYSELDAVALPGEAFPLLLEFRGTEPAAAVRARLRAERQADLDDDVLVVLHQQRILIEA